MALPLTRAEKAGCRGVWLPLMGKEQCSGDVGLCQVHCSDEEGQGWSRSFLGQVQNGSPNFSCPPDLLS